MFLTACNVDNVKSTYTPVSASEVTFAQSVVSYSEIDAKASTYGIDITRNTATAAATVTLKATCPEGVTCPSSVTFNAGEYKATISLGVSDMEIGKSYNGTIEIDESATNANIAISKVTFSLAKAYTWVSMGKGWFCEGFWEGFFNEIEVFEADGFDRWRFMKPYSVSEESTTGGPAYVDLWVNDEGNVQWDTFNTGFDYSGAGDYVKAYWPSDLSANYKVKENYCTFWEDDIIVLFPCFYIDGVGGWQSGYYPIAFCFPGRTQASFEAWLTEQGLW